MGTRNPYEKPRGRIWRRSAGAASFRFVPEPAAPEPPAEGGSVRHLTTSATLRPGDKGARALAAQFGDRLVCVRIRCDRERRKRYKTVELIVAEADWTPPPGPDDPVQVRVAFGEEALRARVKEAGGRWRPESKTWELPLRVARALGLEERIVADAGGHG